MQYLRLESIRVVFAKLKDSFWIKVLYASEEKYNITNYSTYSDRKRKRKIEKFHHETLPTKCQGSLVADWITLLHLKWMFTIRLHIITFRFLFRAQLFCCAQCTSVEKLVDNSPVLITTVKAAAVVVSNKKSWPLSSIETYLI